MRERDVQYGCVGGCGYKIDRVSVWVDEYVSKMVRVSVRVVGNDLVMRYSRCNELVSIDWFRNGVVVYCTRNNVFC